MKKLIPLILLLISATLTAQTVKEVPKYQSKIQGNFLLSYSLRTSIESTDFYDQTPSSFMGGFELQMQFPSKHPHLAWRSGAMFQKGADLGTGSTDSYGNIFSSGNTSTYGGGIYFGPGFSTDYKYVNVSSYIAGGVFSFHDEMFKAENGVILYSHDANFTAPGSKAGFSMDFSYKAVALSIGYQVFVTAGQESTLLYHGFEGGLGIRF